MFCLKAIKKKAVAGIATLTLVIGFAGGVGASSLLEKVTAYKNHGVQFEVDGQGWTPKDQSGNNITALTYNSTTYLPVRAVGEAFDVAVSWDNESQTVELGATESVTSIVDVTLSTDSYAVDKTVDKQYTVQNGVNYEKGFLFNDINSAEKDITLGVNSQYQHASLKAFNLDTEDSITVFIRDKDKDIVLKQQVISPSQKEADIDFDLGGVNNLEIAIEGGIGGSGKAFVTGTLN